MKVLLQHNETRQFAQNEGNWTTDPKQATDFRNPLAAMNFCFRYNLHDASMILHTEEMQYEMPVRCDEY